MAHSELKSLQVHSGSEATFGTAQADFTARDVRCVTKPQVKTEQDWLQDTTQRQRVGQIKGGILGLKKGSLAFSTYLRSTGFASSGSVQKGASTYCEQQLLKNALGGESLGTGDAVEGAAATTTSIPCESAAGLSEGQAVLINGEASPIQSKATNTLTLTRALSSAPTASSDVFGAATYYPVETLSETLQFRAQDASTCWQLLGCQGKLKFAQLANGQLPQFQYEFQAASWVQSGSAVADNDSYSNSINPSPIAYASKLYVQSSGSSTINSLAATNITIDPGIENTAVSSISGIQGISSFSRSKCEPVVSFTVPFDDTWRTTYFDNQTPVYFHLQLGSGVAGSTILIELPKCYVTKVETVEYASKLGTKVSLKATDDTNETGDLLCAALRIHLL